MAKFILNDGRYIPMVGLGTSRIPPKETISTVVTAIEIGYRHFDTSEFYSNKTELGEGIQRAILAGKVTRAELFITAKLAPCYEQPGDIEDSLRKFLHLLQLDYVDMCMLHFPVQFKKNATQSNDHTKLEAHLNGICDHSTLWKELESVVSIGLAKSLGAANFNMSQLKNLLSFCKIRPAVIQTEVHAYLQENDMVEFCKNTGIFVIAFAPLGSPGLAQHKPYYEDTNILKDEVVIALSKDHNCSTGQILLSHHLHRGIGVIPKSQNVNRMKENLMISHINLTESNMAALSQLNKDQRIFRFIFLKNHPQHPFPSQEAKSK